MKLDDRSTQMLKILLDKKTPLTMDDIANKLDISRRSVYYTLDTLNLWMKSHDFSELVNKRGFGLMLDPHYYDDIEKALFEERTIFYSVEERVKILMYILLSNQEQIHIENLVDYMDVSRNTLFNDLKRVRSKLNGYDLDLEYVHTVGYQVVGDTFRIRTTFLYYYWTINKLEREDRLIYDSSFVVFNKEAIDDMYNRLKSIESKLEVEYVIGTMGALSHLGNVVNSIPQKPIIFENSLSYLDNSLEYKYIKEEFPTMDNRELQYLALHLLGSRTQIPNEQEHSPQLSSLAVDMVEEFERISAVKFKEKTKLVNQISSHLSVSYFRYIYGIHHGNPLTEYIKEQYESIYKLTDIVCDLIRQQLEVPVVDSEVAFITLHFSSYINRRSFLEEITIVDIVCPSGVSTSNMIHTEVVNLHPQIKVNKVMSLEDYEREGSNSQYIITTIELDADNAILVNPIMNNNDRSKLLRHLNLEYKSPSTVTVEDIMLLLSPFIEDKHQDNAKLALLNYFDKDNPLDHNRTELSVIDLLNETVVKHVSKELDWIEALRIASESLIDNKCIETRYVDAMIDGIHKFGPYMILPNGYMMAHASLHDGVNQLSLSYTKFDHDISIDNKTFNKLFILAPIDQSRHINIMKDLMSIFSHEQLHDDLDIAKDEKSSIEMIKEFLLESSES